MRIYEERMGERHICRGEIYSEIFGDIWRDRDMDVLKTDGTFRRILYAVVQACNNLYFGLEDVT